MYGRGKGLRKTYVTLPMGIILLYVPILKLSCRTNIVAVVAKKLSQEKDEKRKRFLSFYNNRVFVDLNTFWSTI